MWVTHPIITIFKRYRQSFHCSSSPRQMGSSTPYQDSTQGRRACKIPSPPQRGTSQTAALLFCPVGRVALVAIRPFCTIYCFRAEYAPRQPGGRRQRRARCPKRVELRRDKTWCAFTTSATWRSACSIARRWV